MSKYLLVDASHLFHRARHSIFRGTDSERVGMCLHILFGSLQKAWRLNNANHIVFAFDGRSWRKDVYAPYKRNRADLRAAQTPREYAEVQMFFSAFDEFKEFIATKSNCTVLQNDTLEADDLIAGFIDAHPDDQHVIVSSDADFEQLLSPNVSIYNGVADQTVTLGGVYDYKGKQVQDKKTGQPKAAPDPEWSVFEKCIRGCTSDNIFSAYPGVRIKGSKNKAGLIDAYNDRHKKGFDWNAVMMHRWTDPEGIEHRVLDDYNRNKELVDLHAQPTNIKEAIANTIFESCKPRANGQIGLHFLKLCGKFELVRISEQAKNFSDLLSASYPNK